MSLYGGYDIYTDYAGDYGFFFPKEPYKKSIYYGDYPDDPSLVQRVIFQSPRQLKGDESDLLGSYKKGKRAKRRMNHP